jgi:hypothetical protein
MCEKCVYFDNSVKSYFKCCCEEDRLQILADEKRVRKDGYTCVNDRWVKAEQFIVMKDDDHLIRDINFDTPTEELMSKFLNLNTVVINFKTKEKWSRYDTTFYRHPNGKWSAEHVSQFIYLKRKLNIGFLKRYFNTEILPRYYISEYMPLVGDYYIPLNDCRHELTRREIKLHYTKRKIKFVYID